MLTKQETLLERVESSRVREPRRTALSCGLQPQFYGDGVSFQVVSGQSSDPQSLLVLRASLSQDGCQRGGFWEVVGHVASPFDFPKFFRWWPVSSSFFTRTSCCKITHANSYYGAWPGWAISVSMLPLTMAPW